MKTLKFATNLGAFDRSDGKYPQNRRRFEWNSVCIIRQLFGNVSWKKPSRSGEGEFVGSVMISTLFGVVNLRPIFLRKF